MDTRVKRAAPASRKARASGATHARIKRKVSATTPASLSPQTRVAYARHIRDWLKDQRAHLKTDYLLHPVPDRNLKQHAVLVDDVVATIAADIGLPATAAIVAVGGYGRGFLFPASDVDIVVLLSEKDRENDGVQSSVEAFVSLLWDAGLEPGISVRTVKECVEEATKDITVDTSLLEARAVWGDRDLVDKLNAALTRARTLTKFVEAKVQEQRRRHMRHNDVALNLEPNVKESPGGLRDLQTVMWIAKAAGMGNDWPTLVREGIITADDSRFISKHRLVLVDLRIRLHYLASRREDRLVFDHQTALAAELKLKASRNKTPSEVLMQRYYLSAKAIWQMNSILLPTLIERITHRNKDVVKRIDDEFDLMNGNIAARDEAIFACDPRSIFRAFLALQKVREAEFFEPETLRAMWRAVPQIDKKFRDDPESNQLFLSILRSEKVTFTLRRMSRYGILGRFIPAFGRITGQMQHDLFHVYTVDEHILMVIRNLRRLVLPRFSHEFPFCHELAHDFARPEILYIAALFHDIAKGRGGDHSELGKRDARQFCNRLNISEADTELVVWLVEMHLVMSATAQKQDLSDPDVIAHFATRIRNERWLTALYLLTVADIRGTSPHVWNAWKGKLLEQLFRATRRLLRGDFVSNDQWIENKRQDALRRYREQAGADARKLPALWVHTDASYIQRFEPSEIAWHAAVLDANPSPATAIVKARAHTSDDSHDGYAVMVMARDQPGVFARITGYFEKLSFDIASAKVYTTTHGYALDAFQLIPKAGVAARYKDIIATIERDLSLILNDGSTWQAPSSGRLTRQVKHFPIEPAISLTPWRQKPYYELAVSCADRPGLLSSLARVFLQYGVNLHDARITTLGQRAEDIFIIANPKFAEAKFAQEFQDKVVGELRP